jgi:hypothetical protein
MISISTGFRAAALCLAAFCLSALACGCSRLGIGAKVTDLGAGKYRIATSQASDVAAENDKAARGVCPSGYAVLDKGVSAESLYGSMVLGSDLATFWIVKCK